MRVSQPISRFAVSTSVVAISAAMAMPAAAAQTQAQQQQAQQQNTAVDCSTVTDPAAHATCIRTRGQNAAASEGAPAAGSIVVTGSRIPRPNFDTVQPSTVLNSQAIDQRGFVDAADALNELPQFGIPGSSPVGAAQGGAFGTGQSFVNFLGLGSQRTLVLINGRRFISSNTVSIFGPTSPGEQVDLGIINTKLIDRIETEATGGAPIYGSDAIAGTINVILKHDYSGIDLDAQYGWAEHGSEVSGPQYVGGAYGKGHAPNWRVRGLAGHNFADGRGNVTIAGEFNKGTGFTYLDRAVTGQAPFYARCNPGSQFNQCLYPNGPYINATPITGAPIVGGDFAQLAFPLSPQQGRTIVRGGLQRFFGPGTSFGVFNSSGNAVIFDPAGNLIQQDFGTPPGGPGRFSFFSSGGNGFPYIYDTSQELSNTKKYDLNLLGHYDVSDNIRLFTELWYAHSKATNLSAQPEYNTDVFAYAGQPAGSLILSVNNPFLTAAERTTIINSINNNPWSDQNLIGFGYQNGSAQQDYFYLSRANYDLYNGQATFTTDVFRTVGGLNGKFNAFAGKWNWEAVLNWGRAYSVGRQTDINVQNFNNAVGMVTPDNPNGVPCLNTLQNSPYPTFSATCAPLNLFGFNQRSQAALDYILAPVRNVSENRQFVATADIAGPLFRLPGGDLSVVLGVEHRGESTDLVPSAMYRGPDPTPDSVDENGDGNVTNDIISYTQGSPIPLVTGHFHTNEIFGEINGDLVSPANNIPMIYRLSFQTAARYVKHSVAGGAVTWTAGGRWAPVRDISFRGDFTHAIRSPSIQEAFITASTFFGFATDPCDIDQLNNGPSPANRQANCATAVPPGYISNASSASFTQDTEGNPNLKNETSNAWSAGLVLTPRFIPGLNVSADYISVKLSNAISAFTANNVLNSCYDAPSTAGNPFCALITRNPSSGQLTFVRTSFFNSATFQYRGIVASWDWKARTPFLGRGSTLDWSGSYQHLKTLTNVAIAGSAPTHVAGSLGYPIDSVTTTLNYINGPVSLFTNVNYTGPVNQFNDEAVNFREHNRIKSFTYVNGGARFDVGHGFNVFADVDNIFDVKPPFPVPAGGGAITYYPGVLGRYYRVGAGVHFK